MISVALILAALVVFGLAVVTVRTSLRRRSIKYIQGPSSPSFIFGHVFQLARQPDISGYEFQWMREYGSTFRTKGIFGNDVLFTADPKALQHVFHKSGYNYMKKPSQNHATTLMAGPGIVSTNVQDHLRHRRIMSPAFSAAHLRTFLPLFQRIGNKLSDTWKAKLVNGGGIEVLANKWLSQAAMDIIGEAAFDYNYGALDDGDSSPLFQVYDNLIKDVEFEASKYMLFFRETWDYLPKPILDLTEYIPGGMFARLHRTRSTFNEYAKAILNQQRHGFDADKQTKSKDLMSVLLKANSSADAKTRLNDAELLAQMFTLTLAGHETSSGTLSMLIYELARNHDYQERLRKEIKSVDAKAIQRGDTDFSIEDLDSMTLVMNAIKETLRFHTIVTGLPRIASQDDVIPLALPIVSKTGEAIFEIPIRAGQVINMSFAGYHRLTEVWGEDANVWNPDRFSRDNVGKHTNVGVFSNLMTFSAGLRACIGWRFSVIEMQALIAELVGTFRFDLPEGVEIRHAPSGVAAIPLIRGKEHLGTAMPIRVSLVQ